MTRPEDGIEVPAPFRHLRRFPLDGALLLFDRDSGLNILCDGPETSHLRQRMPRVVQFGVTNRCNLACSFCSRDLTASSDWTSDSAFSILADLAQAGLLEVAFGGGEPWAFPDFDQLALRLYDETPLAVNFTTNGLAMTRKKLRRLGRAYGQIRLSLYDDNNWPEKVKMLVEEDARFGVNYLVTPARLPQIEATVFELAAMGCRDVLLLSYNGADRSLHLSGDEASSLAARVTLLARALSRKAQIKLDVCWGDRMEPAPRLFHRDDCGAGKDFLALTSDKKIMPCSFHHLAIEVKTAQDILDVWNNRRNELNFPARDPGCARLRDYGLGV
jgi:MoaA/NifB/PqqE/SkfB family radical SAM enzyme